MAENNPFFWTGNTGQISTPQEVARQRAVATALYGRNAGADNWAEGLAGVTSVLAGNSRNAAASEAEALGLEKAGGLFAGLNSGSDINQIAAALSSPDAAFMTPGQSSVAEALMGNQMQQNDPMRQLQMAQAQLNYDQDLAGAPSGDAPSSVQEWEYYSKLPPELQSQYLTMKRSNPALNIGTGFVTPDQANPGQVIGAPIAINNEQKAFDTAYGSGAGEAAIENQQNLGNALATAERGVANIEALEADPNLWTAVGALGPLPALPGTPQAGVVSRIEQLQGGTFLEAYNTLKGGGQITEVEGKKAEQAIARLNRAQSEGDFRIALQELKEVIQSGAERARQKAGAPSVSPAPTTSQPITTPEGITIRRID